MADNDDDSQAPFPIVRARGDEMWTSEDPPPRWRPVAGDPAVRDG
jgi:hypothetical protein